MTEDIQTIPTTKLGSHGPLVGIQGLGCMGMSEFYGDTDDAASIATLNRALDLGVTMLDTADMYGMGRNEELIARVLKHRRDDAFIATKFGFVRSEDDPNQFPITNRPEHIQAAAEASLKRLGIEVIDLYYMHRRDPAVPLADSIGAMARLVEQGKVRHLGVSEFSAADLKQAHAIHPIAALQTEWSIFSRDVEAEIVPTAGALGIAFVAYAPLGRGMLTNSGSSGQGGDIRDWLPRFAGEAGVANARLAEGVAVIAARKGVTSAQLALAWLHGRSAVHGLPVIPIPGTRKVSRLKENVRAAGLTLTEGELAELEPLAAAVVGIRV